MISDNVLKELENNQKVNKFVFTIKDIFNDILWRFDDDISKSVYLNLESEIDNCDQELKNVIEEFVKELNE